ncbi:MAG: 2-amino-4-hydroxy-6-hydroxymethyldihydropteridine diphosphokinase [Gammaproteobacteria bacterium]|nr:2-amino-4-hydroxy-6-hydroxymethyldihydropteridine diphosphokinase [Gammaproteobacteria bacterium]
MPRVYVSIGSNVDREKNIRGAIRALRAQFGDVALSPVYETPAEGFTGDNFYNLVAAFDSGLSVEQLRDALSTIEAAHGRHRGDERYAPRTLDIDLLLYGDLIRHEHRLDIPRREITQYSYILGPLAELAPALRHPETGERFADLWQRYDPKNGLRQVAFDTAGDK